MLTTSRRGARRALTTTVAAALTALLLAACGTTEDASDDASATAKASSGPVEVKDERGTVRLDAPAVNVVSLEWGLTETLLALGVKPVGAADVKGYNQWDKSIALDPATPDVGTRGEPSLDAIAALKPDLVVSVTDIPANVLSQIEKTAPVLALRGSDAADPVAYMRRTVTTLAQITGTEDKGEELLAGYDKKIAEGKAALEKAGKAGAPFVMADGWIDSGTVSIRLYTPGSFFGAIGEDLGLKNQWPSGGDKDYGLAQTDLEGLTKITDPKTAFLYVSNDGDASSAIIKALSSNAVWKQLPFVKSGDNLHRIPDGIWMFGGPASAGAYVDAIVDSLAKA
ncbi:ABC transporter substrate-binding protein [Cryptosporangium aurantiacum]|uniref:Iron complex transport system substrate-binding protein n=1 Tax=Cryptosporangium aurantiacum TaxID=134849 RepID=A0A1M7TUN9_9ACTN|nr:iron-siderophore ABC transporter substrate-binding protein [Cryptosporangium aurantiacum]SHN74396.1 iron complex transport system substrate-binding protein [Cryptosporangium aurantiacum]